MTNFAALDKADAKALKLHAVALSKISVPKLHSRVDVLEAQKKFGEYINWVLLQLGTAIHMAVLDAEYDAKFGKPRKPAKKAISAKRTRKAA